MRFALALGIATVALPTATAAALTVDVHVRSYIVTVKSGVPGAVAADVARRLGGSVGHVYSHALPGFAIRLPDLAAERLRRDPRIATVVADQTVRLAAQSVPTGVSRVGGPQSVAAAGDGVGATDVDVAVIDTGIDKDHADLTVAGGTNCAGSSYDDSDGHGTHVAGTIGAKDNGIGVVGVAPGARLWAVRVFGSGDSTTWSKVICGLDWVAARASTIEVANLSLGGPGDEGSCSDGGLHQAVCGATRAGVIVVVAAGNDSANASKHIPAAFDEVLTVSALADFDGKAGGLGSATCRSDKDDTFASFSNYGPDVDFIAPGVCINSTYAGGGYRQLSGTSMASPHVAGAAALVKSTNPTATLADIRTALTTANSAGWSNSDDRDSTKEPLALVGIPGPATTPPPPPDPDGTTAAPAASFTVDCAALKCWFVDTSTDSDGTIKARSWRFGDNTSSTKASPAHLYDRPGTYTVELTVTDSSNLTATATRTIAITNSIALAARESLRSGNLHTVDLSWSGAAGTDIDVYRDGVLVTVTANDGSYRDELSSSGSAKYKYKVCESGSTTTCSPRRTASF